MSPIVPISPEIIGDREKFLLYGEPGMGKTFTALTLPEPILFVAVGGSNEAKTYYSEHFQKKYGKKEIFLAVAEESLGPMGRVEIPEGFDNVCRILDEALDGDAQGVQEFASIVVDNATVLSEYAMYKAVYIDYRGRKVDKQSDATYTKYMAEGLLFPFDSDWGGTQSLMRKFVSWLFRIDKNLAFVAHEYKETVPNRAKQGSDIIGLKPQFIGKDRDMVANQFDNVWHFSRNGQQYVARTEPQGQDPRIIAKTRIGGIIPRNYPDANLSDCIAKFRKHSGSVKT